MKAFCAILLVGVVAFVQANHECDPFAVNVAEDTTTERTGHDKNNEVLSLKEFLKQKKGLFYVTHTTPSTLRSANEFCTAPTHGEECAGVEYVRKIKDGHETFNPQKLFDGVEFETNFIGYDKKDNMAYEYTMSIAGSNNNDFIFKWVKDSPLTARKLDNADPAKETPNTPINPEILQVLQSEFALYSYKAGGYNLYATCDGKYGWVSYDKNITPPTVEDPKLTTAIANLKKVALELKKVELKIESIDRLFPSNLSQYLAAKAA